MIRKVVDNVWKITGYDNVNMYFLSKEDIVIDTGNRKDRAMIKDLLSKLVNLDKIKKVIFTHLHYDHIGNFDLFKNAKFYASKQEISDFKKNPEMCLLNTEFLAKFDIKLLPLQNMNNLKVINTPGHTAGSICLLYKEKILFSGDTLFNNGYGRTDLPLSSEEEMEKSLKKLKEINYKILCPGHDY